MIDLLVAGKDFYWENRDILRGALAVSVIAAVNFALFVWGARQLQELALLRERVSRLADGLALLTDTTEAGLDTLIREVEQLGRRRSAARPACRASVTRRVVAAARKGAALAEIAEREALSESEVRLHLSLAHAASTADRQEDRVQPGAVGDVAAASGLEQDARAGAQDPGHDEAGAGGVEQDAALAAEQHARRVYARPIVIEDTRVDRSSAPAAVDRASATAA